MSPQSALWHTFAHARMRLLMTQNFVSDFWIKKSLIFMFQIIFFQKYNLSFYHLTNLSLSLNLNLNLKSESKLTRASDDDDDVTLIFFLPRYPHKGMVLYLFMKKFLSPTNMIEHFLK